MILFAGGTPIYIPETARAKRDDRPFTSPDNTLDYSQLAHNPHATTPAQVGVHLKDDNHE